MVDDDAAVVDSLRVLLALDGYDVRVESDAHTAVETARVFRPDAVILDVKMPGTDGFTAVRALRRFAGNSPVLIAHTGIAVPDIIDRCRQAGFDYLLQKPQGTEHILQIVRTVVACASSEDLDARIPVVSIDTGYGRLNP